MPGLRRYVRGYGPYAKGGTTKAFGSTNNPFGPLLGSLLDERDAAVVPKVLRRVSARDALSRVNVGDVQSQTAFRKRTA